MLFFAIALIISALIRLRLSMLFSAFAALSRTCAAIAVLSLH